MKKDKGEDMAGALINLVPKRVYDFSALISGTISLVVAEHIDITDYCDAILITRVHDISLSGGNIGLFLQPDGYTPSDGQSFSTGFSAYFNHSTLLDASVLPGTVLGIGGADREFGGEYAMLTVTGSRTAPGPAPVRAVISVDLLLRTPDDVDGVVATAVKKCGGCSC